jgi:hypothetical protein
MPHRSHAFRVFPQGLPPTLAVAALAVIGVLNVAGTYGAGWAGDRMSKPIILSGVFALRGVAISCYAWSAPVRTGKGRGFSLGG